MALGTLASTRDAYGKTLVELGKENPNIVVLDADLSSSTRTCLFAKEFPERFFNMGVAEQDMMGTAAGFAASGKIPFASTFAMFATARCWDQIRNSICYPRLNVKIVASHGGITVGPDGSSHQCLEDLAIMRALPNITVVVPADAQETVSLIKTIAKMHGPVYVRLNRGTTPCLYDQPPEVAIGHSITLKEGSEVAIIACGIMVHASLQAADLLESQGINACVIDMHTIKPLDREVVCKIAKEVKGIVTVEEHTVIGGLGGAVAETVSEFFPVPVVRVGIKDMFGESGSPEELLTKYGLTAKEIAKAARSIVANR